MLSMTCKLGIFFKHFQTSLLMIIQASKNALVDGYNGDNGDEVWWFGVK